MSTAPEADASNIPTSGDVTRRIAALLADEDTNVVATEALQRRRLVQTLHNRKGRFGLLFAVCNEAPRRERLTAEVTAQLPDQAPVRLELRGDEGSLLDTLLAAPGGSEPLFVFGLERLLPSGDEQRRQREDTLQELQLRREQFRRLARPVVLWMPEYVYSLIGIQAVDFWSWHAGTFFFTEQRAFAPESDVRQGAVVVNGLGEITVAAESSNFAGRQDETLRIIDAITRGEQLVLVQGPGGIGKTALAQHVGQLMRDVLDTVVFVEAVRGVYASLAQAIHALDPAARLPEDILGLTAVYRALLRNKHVLIILDGVLDKEAVVPFLPPPGSTLLVTTRIALDLPSADVITLGTLTDREAMALLRTALGDGATEEIADLVRSAGNHPLALNMLVVALRRNGSGAERVREFLSNRQAQSGDGSGERAATLLSELLDSSVGRLDPCQAQTLYQLSVFAAPFDAAAVQAVVRVPGCPGSGGEIDAALKTLEQAGLLAFDRATKLYSVHPLVQQFAQERLTDSEAVQARYAKYWTAQGRSFAEQYRQGGADSEAAVAWFDQNRPHLRAAFDWLRAHDAQRLVEFVQGVTELAAVRLPPEEWIAWLQAQGDAAEQINAGEITAATLLNLGVGHYLAGAPKRAVRFFEQALAAARDIHDRRLEAAALGNLGVAYIDLGDFGRARDFLEAQLSLVRELGDLRGEAAALGNMGDVHLVAGDYEQAEYWYREQLARAEEAGDVRAEAEAMGDWGLVLAGRGEAQQGRRLLERQLKRVRELGDRHSEAAARGNLGTVWAALGNQKAAIGAYEQQLALLRETGSRRGEGKALANLGAAYATQGKARRAVDLYEQALVRQRDSGDRLAEGITLGNLGNAYADLGDQRRALEYLEQGLFALRSVGYTAAEAQILSGLSRVYAALGDTAAASEYRERAQTQTKMQTADAGPAVTQIVVGNVTVFRPAPGRVRGGREPG